MARSVGTACQLFDMHTVPVLGQQKAESRASVTGWKVPQTPWWPGKASWRRGGLCRTLLCMLGYDGGWGSQGVSVQLGQMHVHTRSHGGTGKINKHQSELNMGTGWWGREVSTFS